MKTSKQILQRARRQGWSDKQLAAVGGCSEETIRRTRVEPAREIAWATMWPIYQAIIIEERFPG